MKKLFGELKMTWPVVILFAIAAGVYSSVMTFIPSFRDTSFQDIAHLYEWWVVFAVIIVVNCEKNWEAMLKCFTFFLISQPIWYLVKIVFAHLPIDDAWRTYRGMWLPMTFLTLPGAFIAYYCKKQNALGATVLALGNTIQLVHAIYYFGVAVQEFPRHLLSGLFCVTSVFVMSLNVQHAKKNRLIAILLAVALALGVLVWAKLTDRFLI